PRGGVLRPPRRGQPGLPPAPARLGPPAAARTGRRRAPGARPGLRYGRVHRGPGPGVPPGGDHRSGRVGEHARPGPRQAVGPRGAFRAREGRGADRRRPRRSRRRGLRRLPAAQLPRSRRRAGGHGRPAQTRRQNGPARVLRRRIGRGARRVVAGLLEHRHPPGAGRHRPHRTVPLPVAQRPRLRRRLPPAPPYAGGRAGERADPGADRLAARYRAHLPRPGPLRRRPPVTWAPSDPRAEEVAPPAPRGPRPATAPRTAVVGGGIAGLAAATALSERGVRTTVFEREPGLGGRLRGWRTVLADGSVATMSRGFHAFFRQYYNLRALLARLDPDLGMLSPLPDYPLVHADGLRDGFTGLPASPPLNAFALAARSPSFPVGELAGVNIAAAVQLLDVDVPGVYRRLDHRDAP